MLIKSTYAWWRPDLRAERERKGNKCSKASREVQFTLCQIGARSGPKCQMSSGNGEAGAVTDERSARKRGEVGLGLGWVGSCQFTNAVTNEGCSLKHTHFSLN